MGVAEATAGDLRLYGPVRRMLGGVAGEVGGGVMWESVGQGCSVQQISVLRVGF